MNHPNSFCEKTVLIPNIHRDHPSPECIVALLRLYQNTLDDIEGISTVHFDFSNCNFLANHACVFLGGLDYFLRKKYGISTVLYINIKNEKVNNYLQKIGFFSREDRWSHLPYSDFTLEDIRQKKPYQDIRTLLEQPEFPFRSAEDRQIIRNKIGELFLNVLQHSESVSGCSSSAQFYPGEEIFRFSLVDFGIGIAHKIQTFFADKKQQNLSQQDALLKAFEERFTTKEGSNGLGLKVIREFVLQNRSKLSIFCNKVYYFFDGDREEEKLYLWNTSRGYDGTYIVIDFNIRNIC
ncbi:MAG: hypothetical protein ACYSR9_01170 [Planctomycetota bacterium]|jgi:hypothetical protein